MEIDVWLTLRLYVSNKAEYCIAISLTFRSNFDCALRYGPVSLGESVC
jgi:hypothetical protein